MIEAMLSQTVRRALKGLLGASGMLPAARRLNEARLDRAIRRKYPDEEFVVHVDDELDVYFKTETAATKKWFYPRYEQGGMHEPPVTLAMLDRVRADSIFLDVGAYLGYYTLVMAAKAPEGHVIAVEMDEVNQELLLANAARNRLDNVTILKAAAFDEVTEAVYERNRFSASPGNQIDLQNQRDWDEIRVPTVILDDYLDESGVRPDLIKIDVEGAELRVLRGLKRTLNGEGIRLFVEVHPPQLAQVGDSPDDVVRFLRELGYQMHAIEEHRLDDALAMIPVDESYRFPGNTMGLAEKA